MLIAAFVHFYVPRRNAGSETMLHAMLKSLQDDGHDVVVFATDNPGEDEPYEFEGIPVVQHNWVIAKQLIEQLKPDLIITHHQNTVRAARIAKRIGCKWAFLMHNDHTETVGQLSYQPDLTVFNTEHFTGKYGDRVSESITIHPPVEPERHRATRGDCVTLVNLSKSKGSERFYWLAQQMPDQKFLGVTGGHSPQVFRDLPNVEIIPQTWNMREDVWARTKVLLMPSEYESYGMAGVEALASGIPVIAHPTAGLCESLGTAGIFIDRNYSGRWKDALTELLEGENAYATASEAAFQRSAELDPKAELELWCEAVRSLA